VTFYISKKVLKTLIIRHRLEVVYPSDLKPTNSIVEVAGLVFIGRHGLFLDFFFGQLDRIFKAGGLKAWFEVPAFMMT
jgi:hypothetical protein